MFISEAWAQQAGAGGADLLTSFLPIILIFAVFYFLLIRPQQKKQKAHQAKLNAVRRGDKVVLGGGIFGVVTKVIDDKEIQVEIAEEVRIKALKLHMVDVLSKTEPVANDSGAAGAEKGAGLIGALFGKKSNDGKK